MNQHAALFDLEAFKDHLFNFNKYSYTMMSMILGFDLGLFNILSDAKRPLTAEVFSELAGLTERYVKEWLGAMTAAKIIFIDEDDCVNRYYIPKEYAEVVMENITHGKGLFECVRRFHDVKECFKKEGPMGDPRAFGGEFWKFFHEYRTEYLNSNRFKDETFPRLEMVEELKELLVTGCNVLDIGCGSGALTMAFSRKYLNSSFTGIDISMEQIDSAKKKVEGHDLVNPKISFLTGSTADLVKEVGQKFDVILMYQVLHNLPDPVHMISEVNDLLKPGGKLVLNEIRLHSNHMQNVGDLGAALQLSISQFFCLPFSMSEKPHKGFGAGWEKRTC